MMRHWVNFGLVFSFATLAVTGALAFLRPFSLVNTRVHIIFGILTVLLVLLHVVSRTRYFSGKMSGRNSARRMVTAVVLVWCGTLAVALGGLWPVPQVVDAGYEARHKAQIVRTSPLAGWLEQAGDRHFVARQPGPEADTAVSLLVRLRDGLENPPAMAVWAETTVGTIIETLYLDQSLAYSEDVEWGGIETTRVELLPIWRHRYTMVSGMDPHGEIDAFTGSTPSHSFSLDSYLKTGEDTGFVLCVEVNATGDANETWADPDIGQPSLLYTAYVEPGSETEYALLELTAHGGLAGKGGSLGYDFEGIQSAKRLIDLLLMKHGTASP